MLTRNLVKALIIVFGLVAIAGVTQYARGATTLLPNGEQCFQTGAGPVVAGSINMYTVGTTTPKTTWTNSSQSAVNTNPIQLDANGCAIIYGVGSYRQQLWSGPVVGGVATGNLIYDLTTTDTSASNATFWAGTAAGTPNAITVVDAGFSNTDGSVINFLASNTNTAATTLAVSGGSAINVEQITSTGPAALTAGCIVLNNPVSVVYSSTLSAFVMLTPCATSTPAPVVASVEPEGYLTPNSDPNSPVAVGDVIGSTAVYYSPFVGNQIPIWNGAIYGIFNFTQLVLTLSSTNNLANTIYDVFVFSNSGTPVLVTGPAWATSSIGASARGTGAGTTALQRINGLWTNANAISATNGASTYSIPLNQGTYVGSILTDQAAGQVSNLVSYGQNRKWGVWNAYNRSKLSLIAGDPTSSWTSSNIGWRFSNATGGNAVTTLTGLNDQPIVCQFNQLAGKSVANTSSVYLSTAIGVNVAVGQITPTAGLVGTFNVDPTGANWRGASTITAINEAFLLGNNIWQSEENTGGSTAVFSGTNQNMVLLCNYQG